MGKKLIIFTDIGDTIIDESTEVRKVSKGVVYHASCIPGAKEAMLTLYARGYTIAMVADGLTESFHNTMRENGLSYIFSAEAVSEDVGQEKPSPVMFETAMKKLGLTDADKPRIIMVGNNVERDMAGAKRFGIRSVQLVWSHRHPCKPSCPEEEPDFRIYDPSELPPLVEQLERQLETV
jgi:putative hydrolase of the HAD superfamily